MDIQKQLIDQLAKTIGAILGQDVTSDDLKLSTPPQENFGDYALACFGLAKKIIFLLLS